MDTENNEFIKREFDQSGRRLTVLEERMGELSEHYAAMSAKMTEMAEQRKEMRTELQQWRSEISPIVDWVKAQMVPGGLLSRMEKLETETKREFKTIQEDLNTLKDFVSWARTYGAALMTVVLFVWSIFGDKLKVYVLGK